jgi:hypothetical protein
MEAILWTHADTRSTDPGKETANSAFAKGLSPQCTHLNPTCPTPDVWPQLVMLSKVRTSSLDVENSSMFLQIKMSASENDVHDMESG